MRHEFTLTPCKAACKAADSKQLYKQVGRGKMGTAWSRTTTRRWFSLEVCTISIRVPLLFVAFCIRATLSEINPWSQTPTSVLSSADSRKPKRCDLMFRSTTGRMMSTL
jgi:hypothetical protein